MGVIREVGLWRGVIMERCDYGEVGLWRGVIMERCDYGEVGLLER